MSIIFREALEGDIPQMQVLRHAVKENILSDPGLVTDNDCLEYITVRGKGWVSESNGRLTGFAIVDLQDHNIWALFVHPDFENQGIGRRLHHLMLDWYFKQTTRPVWLGTAPNTRAEGFYAKMGWTRKGLHGTREIKFEMTRDEWRA